VDSRTKLAGSNKMELLLFSLGTSETFGINVFKVREVSPTPPITLTPNMPFGVEGVISLRGSIIPVISLAKFIKLDDADSEGIGETMIVTEFSRHTQGSWCRKSTASFGSTGKGEAAGKHAGRPGGHDHRHHRA
jgi:two-component system chemotaxis response regulator CheV